MKALANWILKEKLGFVERACEKPNIHIGFSRELLLEKLFHLPFKYRRKITITEQSGNDLTYYQVLIELNSTNFDFTHAQTNGEDIRFTDASGNLLDYWIEEWDAVNKTAKVWVKAPSIPANSSVEIFMYYGNPEITSASDASATFIRVIDGLVASWHFDEGSGTTAYDSSGNNYDGTVSGAIWDNGKFNKALNFDGTDDRVDCGDIDALDSVTAISITAWVYRHGNGVGDWNGIVNKRYSSGSPYNVWSLDFYSNTHQPEMCISSSAGQDCATSPENIPLNEWVFIVGTFDNSEIKLYVDGIEKASLSKTGPSLSSEHPVTIGAIWTTTEWYHFFDGLIDEVNIFNKALTTEEISDLYNNYGYSTENYPGKVLVRKYTEPEPSVSLGVEETV